jgi:hypothetical protein
MGFQSKCKTSIVFLSAKPKADFNLIFFGGKSGRPSEDNPDLGWMTLDNNVKNTLKNALIKIQTMMFSKIVKSCLSVNELCSILFMGKNML